jgi:hypothetical protein
MTSQDIVQHAWLDRPGVSRELGCGVDHVLLCEAKRRFGSQVVPADHDGTPSVTTIAGARSWTADDSFGARLCAFSSRGNASSRPTIPSRAGPRGDLGPQFTACFTSAAILSSSAAVNSVSAKEVGHMAPSSRFAMSLKPNVAYRELNLEAAVK